MTNCGMAITYKELKQFYQSLNVRDYKMKHGVMTYIFCKTNKLNGNYAMMASGYCNYSKRYCIEPFTVRLYFKEVESKMDELLLRYGVITEKSKTTISKVCMLEKYKNYFSTNYLVSNVEDFQPLRVAMQEIIDEKVFPFIDNYNDNLKNVSELLMGLDFNNNADYQFLYPSLIKSAYILKIMEHKNYKERLVYLYEKSLAEEEAMRRNVIMGKISTEHPLVLKVIHKLHAFEELFYEDLETCGYKIDHRWERGKI